MPTTHVLGGLSIDAVRYADGSYDVDRLGGNAFWAVLGTYVAGGRPQIHAVVGDDYPQSALERLAELGGTGGVVRRADVPSTRVSFSYASDGSRRQPADPEALAEVPATDRRRFLDNTGDAELLLATLPSGADLGVAADAGAGPGDAWHLGLLPAARLRDLVDHLGGVGHLQVDCPDREELLRAGPDVLPEVLAAVDVFLPSTSDAAVFLPGATPSDLIETFHRWGARAVVLKCGDTGALVSAGGRRWHVPVFRDPREFDPTGAGDVFGGAFLRVMAVGGDLVAAAVAGAAAASFATAVRGPLELTEVRTEVFESRRRFIASRVEEV